MKIAIDVSPLKTGHFLQHRVRGTGFYVAHLLDSLKKYYPENEYIEVVGGKKKPPTVDVFHIPYFEPFFKTIPLRTRVKTVVTVHDLTPLVFPKHFPPGIKGFLKWKLQKRSLKKVDAIITDSKSSKKDIIKLTGIEDSKIHVVYLAADEKFKKLETGNWKMEIQKKYGLPEKFTLYVGDATWNKNLPRLVRAVEKAQVPCVLAGSAIVTNVDTKNPWNKDLVEVQKYVKNNPLFVTPGFVPDEDLVGFYNLATVFVMPSLYEGFGLPILEAMQSGCPVICSREGSLAEVAGDAAYVIDAYNTENISSGIKKVFESEELQKELSEKGIVQAQKFSWKKTAKETTQFYENVKNY